MCTYSPLSLAAVGAGMVGGLMTSCSNPVNCSWALCKAKDRYTIEKKISPKFRSTCAAAAPTETDVVRPSKAIFAFEFMILFCEGRTLRGSLQLQDRKEDDLIIRQ